MRRFLALVIAAWALVGCSNGKAPARPNCNDELCVGLQVSGPVQLNQTANVTITVQPSNDIPGLKIYLAAFPTSVAVEGDRQWVVDARANQAIVLRGAVKPTQEGIFRVFAQASNPLKGGVTTDYVRVLLTNAGGTVYLAGTPLPVTPVVIKTPPPIILNAQGTPIPSPTKAGVPPMPVNTAPPQTIVVRTPVRSASPTPTRTPAPKTPVIPAYP